MVLEEKLGRRDFIIKSAAAATAFSIVPRHVLGGPGQTPPSGKLNIAGIGFGGQGKVNLRALEKDNNIIALCDVDPVGYAKPVFDRYPQAKVYTDFREMLANQKDIDAVVIATPDHTHAVIAMAAMKAGKHVFCQKPLAHNVWEARMLAEAAAKMNVVTQMGIQGHSGEGSRLICEWIWAGLIGDVTEVDAWCADNYYPRKRTGFERPTEKMPVPEGMKWDLWLGPAAERPYHRAYHPGSWRSWLAFGNGWMGDRGVHTIDPVATALKLGAPTSIDATTCGQTKELHCLSGVMTFWFPAREGMPPVKLTWYEGTRAPRPEELEPGRNLNKEGGVVFKGTKGKIICGTYGESPRIIPESKMKAAKLPPKTLPRVPGGMEAGHERDWTDAIKADKKAGACFEYGGPLTEICLLGNIAKRVDTTIEWDAKAMKITNNEEANKYLKDAYREGWSL